ncbi:MAG: acylphosphatase [Methanobacteriota archaeon]
MVILLLVIIAKMKQKHIIVYGDVQRVGYRDRVHKIANRSGITGEIRNLDELDVEIIAEGTEEQLAGFITAIHIQEYPIHVEGFEVREKEYTGAFHSFRIIRGNADEELSERMDTAIQHLSIIGQYSKNASENSNILIDMMHSSLGKQDQMLGKQDLMIQKQDQMIGKQDLMVQKQDSTLEEIKGLRSDIRTSLSQEVAEMRGELKEVRATLIRAGLMEQVSG